jgi:hypothetical protein
MNDLFTKSINDWDFEVNEKLAGIVPMAVESEQLALAEDIKIHGLRDPIVLYKDKVIDGRCRLKALFNLKHSGMLHSPYIPYKQLDPQLTEDEVKVFVKSVNTRRNLTNTQKAMVAAKSYLETKTQSTATVAASWGISRSTLDKAIYISREHNGIAEALFNGHTVTIVNDKGKNVSSNKISAVYSYLRRLKQTTVKTVPADYEWDVTDVIESQEGKDFFFNLIKSKNVTDIDIMQWIAQGINANYTATEQKPIDPSTIKFPYPNKPS